MKRHGLSGTVGPARRTEVRQGVRKNVRTFTGGVVRCSGCVRLAGLVLGGGQTYFREWTYFAGDSDS